MGNRRKTPLWVMQRSTSSAKCETAAVTYSRRRFPVASRLRWTLGLVGVIALLAALSGSFAGSANAGLLGTGYASYCSPYLLHGVPGLGRSVAVHAHPGRAASRRARRAGSSAAGQRSSQVTSRSSFTRKGDSRSLYMPKGSTASTPTMCFAPGDWHMRFVGTGYGQIRVAVTVNSLLGLLSILDGGTVTTNGTWKPSPKVGLLLTNVTACSRRRRSRSASRRPAAPPRSTTSTSIPTRAPRVHT